MGSADFSAASGAQRIPRLNVQVAKTSRAHATGPISFRADSSIDNESMPAAGKKQSEFIKKISSMQKILKSTPYQEYNNKSLKILEKRRQDALQNVEKKFSDRQLQLERKYLEKSMIRKEQDEKKKDQILATDVDKKETPSISIANHLKSEDDILIYKGLTEYGVM